MADVNATQQMLGTSTSSDGNIPIEFLDFDYIGKCKDAKELEKIYKVLRSGTEGYYPDLVEFCEKKLADVAPKSKLLRKEVQPATEYDLGKEEWTKVNNEVKEWADGLSKQGGEDDDVHEEDKLPPVRNRGVINTAGKKNESSKEDWGKPSAERIKGSDFRSWDKYDAEAEEAKVDEKAKDETMKAAYEKLANARSAAEARSQIDTSGMSDRERETVANREKDKGNEAFRASDYQEAILYYSRSLSVVPSAPAFNNRSLARIKLGEYDGAVEDCTKVLQLEPNNIKALLRRGTARKSLKNYELALKDLQAVLQVEPNNKQALDMINDVVAKMEKEKTQIETELKKKGTANGLDEKEHPDGKTKPRPESKTKSGGRRLVIQEVEEDESGGEEDADSDKKDGNVSKLASKRKDTENKTANEAMNGSNETDGISTQSKEHPSSLELPNHSTSKDVPQTSPAANHKEEKEKEVIAPTPPKPPKPLPDIVISFKDSGNDFFKKGQYVDANKRYSKAINTLKKDSDDHAMGLSTLYSNRASCYLKSGDPKSSIEDCTSSLNLNPNNVKTYLKRAQAYEMLEKYEYAYVDFKTAVNYDAYNVNAQNGASRMLLILKDKHGKQWREKLPSQPKSPSIPWPTYVTSNLNSTMPSSSTVATTVTTDSKSYTSPVSTPAPMQTTQPAAHTSTEQTSSPVASSSSAPSAEATPTQNEAPPTPKGDVDSPRKTTPTSESSPASTSKLSSGGAGAKTRSTPAKPKTKEERFQEFKTQGNDLVKKGEYSQAISCYTRSIDVDPSQAVSYSNRALCYLKLGLPDDAIEDCNEALKRDPKGIKAFYRRAQARKMLGNFQESIKDLRELLKLEPNNAPAKKELDLVKEIWLKDLRDQQNKAEEESSQKQGKAEEEKEGKKKKKSGKRMQIEEVNESSDEDKPVSSKNKTQSTSQSRNHSEGKATASPASEKGASGTGRKENKKNDGNASGGKEKASKTTSSGVASPLSGPKRMTAYEFMQEWTSLKKKKHVEGHAKLLKQVQPNDIPKVLSNKLDGEMLGKILSASANHLAEEDPVFTYQLLNKLRSVDRFKTVAMFLSKMDKDNMRRCINMISSKPDICKEEDLKKLKKAYQL